MRAETSKDFAIQRADIARDLAVHGAELRNAISNSAMDAIKASRLFVFQMIGAFTAVMGIAMAFTAFRG